MPCFCNAFERNVVEGGSDSACGDKKVRFSSKYLSNCFGNLAQVVTNGRYPIDTTSKRGHVRRDP